jgi:type IV secretory pathway TraG/TraD family ATPase VirD4
MGAQRDRDARGLASGAAEAGAVTVKIRKPEPARQARAALRSAGRPAALLTAAAVIQYAHVLPPVPYAWMTAGGIVALRGRDGLDAIRVRRSGGKAAERRRRAYQGTASASEVRASLSVAAARKRAKVTRPSAGGSTRGLTPAEAGVIIGKGGKPARTLMGSHEDFYLLYAPPRSGKTGWMSGVILDAPGAAVTTSTRVDVYAHTVIARAGRGQVITLNPGGDGCIPTTLTWSPLEGCEHPAVAIERAGYLMAAAPSDKGGKDAWWDARGADLLRLMMHAAALAGATMHEAARWARDPRSPEPAAILAGPDAAAGWAHELAAMTSGDGEQLDGIAAAASGALSWMADPVMAAIACPDGDGFDAVDFLLGSGTLYLIATDRPHSSVAPYFAALTAHVWDTAKRLASVMPGGRLDPPLSLVADEPAITCRIPLDRWSAEAGGHGITIVTGVQSPAQLVSCWGESGAKVIRDNASVQLVLGGRTDHAELEALSAVCGHRDSWEHVRGPDGGKTRQPRQERLFPPEQIRTLRPWQAVLLHRSARPLLVRLAPAWERPGYQRAPAGWTAPPPAQRQPQAIEAPRRDAIPVPAEPAPPAITDRNPAPTEESTRWPSQTPATSPCLSPTAGG